MYRPKGSKNKTEETPKKEVGTPPVGTGKPPVEENAIYIEGLPEKKELVLAMLEEQRLNPGVVHEGDAGIVFIEGQPNIIIDNQYVPHDKAQLVLQERKVIIEFVKLEKLKLKSANKEK